MGWRQAERVCSKVSLMVHSWFVSRNQMKGYRERNKEFIRGSWIRRVSYKKYRANALLPVHAMPFVRCNTTYSPCDCQFSVNSERAENSNENRYILPFYMKWLLPGCDTVSDRCVFGVVKIGFYDMWSEIYAFSSKNRYFSEWFKSWGV
jgi:hypothetical protein